MDNRIRVLVAGAHPVFQLGLMTAIQADSRLTLVAEIAEISEGATRAHELAVDALVVYTDVPHRAVAKIMECLPADVADTHVLILTPHGGQAEVIACLRAGVHGYAMLTHLRLEELCAGIVTLVMHGAWLCPFTLHHLMAFAAQHAVDPLGYLTTKSTLLSEREVAVLRMSAAGAGEMEIAVALSISPNTVKTYLHRICQKMNVSSRAGAVRRAIMLNLIPDRRARPA